jgi:hypothetical protein
VDHYDICSPSDRQQGAHCHDPHGCSASLYDPYELFRHDLCDRFSNETHGAILALPKIPVFTAAAALFTICSMLFPILFGRVFLLLLPLLFSPGERILLYEIMEMLSIAFTHILA